CFRFGQCTRHFSLIILPCASVTSSPPSTFLICGMEIRFRTICRHFHAHSYRRIEYWLANLTLARSESSFLWFFNLSRCGTPPGSRCSVILFSTIVIELSQRAYSTEFCLSPLCSTRR